MMVLLSRTFFKVPVSSCARAPDMAAASAANTATKTSGPRTGPGLRRLGFGRCAIDCRRRLALPAPDHGAGQAVADHIRGGAAHVEKLVDADDQQQSGLGQPEGDEGCRDDDQ